MAATLVLAWSRLAEIPPAALGFVRPRRWLLTLAGGTAFGVALKLALKAIVLPLLGVPAINATYHHLVGNTAALPAIVVTILVSAGFGEEVLFRGYLFERLRRLFGPGRAAGAAILLLSSVLFAFAHYHDQGWPGVGQALVTGLVFGGIYARLNEIWVVMVAHTAFDLAAVAIIYWDLEEAVAHLVFR